MREFTQTEAIDLVGRFEAGQEIPERMRADVRMLGSLLGRVLRESGSAGLYEDVERLRVATIHAYTDDTPEAFASAVEIADSFTIDRADEVARAFTAYFHLVNLAEEHQRVRILRERDGRPDREDATDSVAAAFVRLAAEVGDDTALARLQALRFHPVFTAHPTEARRRAISTSIRRLAAFLEEHDASLRNGADQRRARASDARGDRHAVAHRASAPREALAHRRGPRRDGRVRRDAVHRDPARLPPRGRRAAGTRRRRARARGAPVRARRVVGRRRPRRQPVRDGVGHPQGRGDRERARAPRPRAHREPHRSRLTLDASTTPPSDALLGLWQRLKAADEDAATEIAKRSPNEPHRRILLLIARKVSATRARDADLAYTDPEELLADLRVVQDSLVQARAPRQAYGHLQQLLWQVETFGFHLTELEVRQHSAVHAKVLAELDAGGPRSELAEEVLDVFRAVAFLQKRYGPRAAGRYIVSFTQSAQDLANVHRLARYATGDAAAPVLDVVPLFETFADLQAAPRILAEIVEHPEFAARLDATGRRLEVMLGYSDSSKDVGPVAANLALYVAQAAIAAWAQENRIELTLFHGRGGALGRGGGPANSAILAQPPHSVDGRFKLTEQGEVIFARYGDPAIAMRHIDQVAAAVLMASAPSIEDRNRDAAARYADVAATMDTASRARFFELVKAPGFAPWFAQVTPMEEVGLLALGSRPARRGLSVESLEDLRAIPWVFAWTQARINLAGWFGLGTALDAVGDEDMLRRAYREWPLFQTMVDNVAMSLAKADPRIARHYLDLGDREDLAELVMEEMELTRLWVVRVTAGSDVLDNKPVLQRAVKMRSPYVDALSLLQLRALRALRADAAAGAATDPEQQRLLLLSVSGVAAGLQNTG